MLRTRQRHQNNQQQDQLRQKRLKQTINKKPKIKPQQWINLFKNNNSKKIKKHIIHFFLIQGHYDIAKQFAQQANIDPKQILEINYKYINQRYEIVKMIKEGQIDEALQKIQLIQNCNILNSGLNNIENFTQIKDENKSKFEILFCLNGLKVINLIKQKKIQNAVIFARKQLLPFVKIDPSYMTKIQQIMSLLVFPNMKQCSSYFLTTYQYRSKISKQINLILFESENNSHQFLKPITEQNTYISLSEILKLTQWLEKRLQNYLQFPKINLQNLNSQKIFHTIQENL